MNECIYNYGIDENLLASKQLYLHKTKKKTSIVTFFVLCLTVFGLIASVGAIIKGSKYWFTGLFSIALIVGYFGVDKVCLFLNQKNQRKFFENSTLNKVTKVRVIVDENSISETFLIKEKELGTNSYFKQDLIGFKMTNDEIYYIFKNEKIVMIKKACLTEKSRIEFLKFAEHLMPKKNKTKNTTKNV